VEHVAAALGQTGPAVTRRHYLAAGAKQDGKQRAALRLAATKASMARMNRTPTQIA
jgi:hypothetical protein